ncbi:MAG: helix-turn-helix transcriptional regulator, partial [Burkholderia sp.]
NPFASPAIYHHVGYSVLMLDLCNNARKGLTQEQVAEAIKVEQETISRFERGATLPPLGRLLDIANLLDVPLETLVRSGSPRMIDQATDIAALLETLSEETREWVQTWLTQLCRKLAPNPT